MAKKKRNTLLVENPVFKCDVFFVWNVDYKELQKILKRKFDVVDDFEFLAGADGTALRLDGYPCRVVWLETLSKKPYDIGLAAHEILHVALRICEDKGVPFSEINNEDETLAYLVDFYMRSLFNFYEKK